MDVLIVDDFEPEVVRWLAAHHWVRYCPELADDGRGFRKALVEARSAIVPSTLAVGAAALRHAARLQAIGSVATGADGIDLDACEWAGVAVLRGLTASAQAEAEFMLGAVLSLLRRRGAGARDGGVGREIGGSTVGLIGLTPAAHSMARLLAAFGARVVGYEPAVHATDAVWARWGVEPVALRELLGQADAVCVQLTCFSRYRGLLGSRLLPACKPEQVIVSIGQSSLFDETALASALRSGRIAAAWLDSVEPGTLDPGRPLAGLPTLQVTPRLAGTTRESRLRGQWEVARHIDRALRHPARTPSSALRRLRSAVRTGLEAGSTPP